MTDIVYIHDEPSAAPHAAALVVLVGTPEQCALVHELLTAAGLALPRDGVRMSSLYRGLDRAASLLWYDGGRDADVKQVLNLVHLARGTLSDLRNQVMQQKMVKPVETSSFLDDG